MRFAITILGLDLLTVEMDTDDGPPKGPGDATAQPVGFTVPPKPGDQRWEKGLEP